MMIHLLSLWIEYFIDLVCAMHDVNPQTYGSQPVLQIVVRYRHHRHGNRTFVQLNNFIASMIRDFHTKKSMTNDNDPRKIRLY